MESELFRYILLAWVVLHLAILFPLYLARSFILSRRKVIKPLVLTLVFAAYGIVILQVNGYFRAIELGMLLGFPAIAIVIYLVPQLLDFISVRKSQPIALRESITQTVITDSLKAFTKDIETNGDLDIHALIKPNRWYEFNFVISKDTEHNSTIVKELKPVGSSYTYFRLLIFLGYYAVIAPIIQESFMLPVPFIKLKLDAELSFVVLMVVAFIYLSHMITIQQQFQDEFVEIQEVAKVNLVKKLAAKKTESDEPSSTGNSALDAAKEKAQSIKDMRFKEEVKRRQEEMKGQINKILGNDEEDGEHFESEIYQKQLLIRKIQRILNSTPIGKEIELSAIAEKVKNDDTDMVESIIVGLISNNNVKGRYDIWEKKFLVGDASSRFIEQTLENLRVSPTDFEYIKISKSGDVEIKFDKNEKKSDDATNS